MERFVVDRLRDWRNRPDRLPLIVRGMRQIGKTWAIREFARRDFGNSICEIDFEYDRSLKRIFDSDLDPVRICREIEALTGKLIRPGVTLLFFDEIQACPRALESLRYFSERMPDLHVIAAGSLLEFALEQISFPVGRVSFLEMNPMTFAEFVRASGNSSLDCLLSEGIKDVGEAIHGRMLSTLREYLFCGGLPACVKTWHEDKSYVRVREVQNDLLAAFRQDFAKYPLGMESSTLETVWDGAARSVSRQSSFASISREYSGTTNKKAIDLLSKIRLVKCCRAASAAKFPFDLDVTPRFKFFAGDIGLWQAQLGYPAKEIIETDDVLATYQGALAEQFVAQELAAALGRDEPHWWKREKRNSNAEVDFIVAIDGRIQPIEVKNGPSGRLRSLHQLLIENPSVADGVVLSPARFGEMREQRLRFVPIYYAGELSSAK